MTLCRDCKFYKKEFSEIYDICRHPSTMKKSDKVRGEISYPRCEENRDFSNLCGSSGKLFEEKENFIYRLIKLIRE